MLALSMSVLAMLAIRLHVNPFLAMLACLAVGLSMGMVNGLLLTRLHLPHPFISTLGTMNVARGLALIITGAAPISGFDRAGAAQVLALGAGTFGVVPVALVAVILVYVVFHLLLSDTALGRHIYAVGGNQSAARLSGINVDRTLLIVYSISGLMAGFAALMLAGRTNSGYPTAGTGYELDAIAAVIIGGASFAGGSGTVWGTAIGVALIAVLRNGLVLLESSDRVAGRGNRPGDHRGRVRGRASPASAPLTGRQQRAAPLRMVLPAGGAPLLPYVRLLYRGAVRGSVSGKIIHEGGKPQP